MPGVRVVVEPQREYREGVLLSHILGFVGPVDAEEYARLAPAGYQLNDRIGKAGVEFTYESLLRGTPGSTRVETDASGREIKVIDETPATARPQRRPVDRHRPAAQGRRVSCVRAWAIRTTPPPSSSTCTPATSWRWSRCPTTTATSSPARSTRRRLNKLIDDPAKPMLDHAISRDVRARKYVQAGHRPGGAAGRRRQRRHRDHQSPAISRSRTSTTPDRLHLPRLALRPRHDELLPRPRHVIRRVLLLPRRRLHARTESSSSRASAPTGWRTGRALRPRRARPASTCLARRKAWCRTRTGKRRPSAKAGCSATRYNFGIGQGYLAATPLQMLLVTAAIANGGDVLIPHVVKELHGRKRQRVPLRRDTVKRKLNVDPRNFDDHSRRHAGIRGRRRGLRPPQVPATLPWPARPVRPSSARRSRPAVYQEHGWFTGFAPFDNPEIAVVVFMEQGNGRATAAPVASKIFDYYFNQLQRRARATRHDQLARDPRPFDLRPAGHGTGADGVWPGPDLQRQPGRHGRAVAEVLRGPVGRQLAFAVVGVMRLPHRVADGLSLPGAGLRRSSTSASSRRCSSCSPGRRLGVRLEALDRSWRHAACSLPRSAS